MTLRTALFWAAAGCCVLAELAILRSLLFGRARDAERRLSDGRRRSRPVEVAWAILPAAGLLLILYLTWRAVDVPASAPVDVTHSGATIGA